MGDAITFVTVINIALKIVEQNTHEAVMKELKYLSQSMMVLSALIEYEIQISRVIGYKGVE